MPETLTGMDPEAKAKWVAALRSGEFEQGTGTLNHDGKFCCLGVLCEIYADWLEVKQLQSGTTYDGYSAHLPKVLEERLSVSDRAQTKLINMNDSGEYGFHRIANWIEANL